MVSATNTASIFVSPVEHDRVVVVGPMGTYAPAGDQRGATLIYVGLGQAEVKSGAEGVKKVSANSQNP